MRALTSISAAVAAFFTAMGYFALSDYFAAFGLDHMLMTLSAYPMMARFGLQVMSNTPQVLPILLAIAMYIALLAYAMKSRRRFPNTIYHAKGKRYHDDFVSGWLNIVFNRRMDESFRIWARPLFTGVMLLFVIASSIYAEARSEALINAALSGRPIGLLNATAVTERVELEPRLSESLKPFMRGRELRLLWDSDRELTVAATPKNTRPPFTIPIIHIDKATGNFYSIPLTFHSFKANKPLQNSPFFSTLMLTLGALMLFASLVLAALAYFETKDQIADLTITWHDARQEVFQLPLRVAQRMYDALVDGQAVEFRERGKDVRDRLYRLSAEDRIELFYTPNGFTVKSALDSATQVLKSRR